MKYIKLFEDFDVDGFHNSVESTLAELEDDGFKPILSIFDELISLEVYKKDKSEYVYSDIKDYVLTIIDYYNETVGNIDISYYFNTIDDAHNLHDTLYQAPALMQHTFEPEDNRLIYSLSCYILIKKDEGAGNN